MDREEINAINTLKRLAIRWPPSLWLWSGSGTLHVMRKDAEGKRVMLDNGGVDPAYAVTTIEIENDGGDW